MHAAVQGTSTALLRSFLPQRSLPRAHPDTLVPSSSGGALRGREVSRKADKLPQSKSLLCGTLQTAPQTTGVCIPHLKSD